jgi:hypothetical protein
MLSGCRRCQQECTISDTCVLVQHFPVREDAGTRYMTLSYLIYEPVWNRSACPRCYLIGNYHEAPSSVLRLMPTLDLAPRQLRQ